MALKYVFKNFTLLLLQKPHLILTPNIMKSRVFVYICISHKSHEI